MFASGQQIRNKSERNDQNISGQLIKVAEKSLKVKYLHLSATLKKDKPHTGWFLDIVNLQLKKK